VAKDAAPLKDDIEAYEAKKTELEKDHLGEWTVFHGKILIDIYPDFETAAKDAVAKYGRGPFLIRQVGAPPVVLPASVMYRVT